MKGEAIVLAHEAAFRLGDGQVDPAMLRLSGPTGEVHLEPKAMAVLVALHRAGGGVLSRDDLIEQCWDGRIVGDDALNRVIGQLRKALQAGGVTVPIETIPRVGFRLGGQGQASLADERLVDRRMIMLGGGAALAATGAGAWWLSRPALPEAARDAIERGRIAMADSTSESLATANAAFREATVAAPDAAAPWGLLAVTYASMASGGDPARAQEHRRRAFAAAERALAIDADEGSAHAARLWLQSDSWSLVRYGQAIDALSRRAPKDPIAAQMAGYFHAMVGRPREALASFDRFERWIGPNPRSWPFRAGLLASLGRDDEADQLYSRAIERWPRHYAVWFPRLKHLMYSGRGEQALAMLADRANRPTGVSDYNFEVCHRQALACATPSAAMIADGMAASRESAQRGHGYAENAMLFAAHVGPLDQAFELTQRVMLEPATAPRLRFDKAAGRYANRVRPATNMLFMPAMRRVRRDARIKPIYTGTGLTDYWRAAGRGPDVA